MAVTILREDKPLPEEVIELASLARGLQRRAQDLDRDAGLLMDRLILLLSHQAIRPEKSNPSDRDLLEVTQRIMRATGWQGHKP